MICIRNNLKSCTLILVEELSKIFNLGLIELPQKMWL